MSNLSTAGGNAKSFFPIAAMLKVSGTLNVKTLKARGTVNTSPKITTRTSGERKLYGRFQPVSMVNPLRQEA